MANFEEQVEGIVSFTIPSSNVTSAEVTQFLTDGVKDVTSKIVQIRPELAKGFSVSTTLNNTTTTLTVDSGVIVNVWRETASDTDLEAADEINAKDRFRATDSSS